MLRISSFIYRPLIYLTSIAAITLAQGGCSSANHDAKAGLTEGAAKTCMRYYTGPKGGLWPDPC